MIEFVLAASINTGDYVQLNPFTVAKVVELDRNTAKCLYYPYTSSPKYYWTSQGRLEKIQPNIETQKLEIKLTNYYNRDNNFINEINSIEYFRKTWDIPFKRIDFGEDK